jgi:uncharacterized protein YbjT (DUF2867 family)
MTGKTAAVIGATGLIGFEVLKQLLDDNYFSEVHAIVRRPLLFKHEKLKVITIDFTDPASYKNALSNCHAVFCAVGTTQSKVKGDMEQYRKVDYDIPVHAAEFSKENDVEHFSLVSSVGANSAARNFYLRLKGEVEEAVMKFNLPSVSIMRPSMLLGDRKEFRLGEKIAQTVMRPFKFLIPSKYKPIQASAVAQAMIAASKRREKGVRVMHYREMMAGVNVS